jgi:hypothetical protein
VSLFNRQCILFIDRVGSNFFFFFLSELIKRLTHRNFFFFLSVIFFFFFFFFFFWGGRGVEFFYLGTLGHCLSCLYG